MENLLKSKTINLGEYVIYLEKELGRGTFGRVYLASDGFQNLFAAKEIPLRNKEVFRHAKQEIQIMLKLNSPFIVRLFHFQKVEGVLYFIMELCRNKSCKELLERYKNGLPEQVVFQILLHILQGYSVLYDNKIIHRDLKPENILLDEGIAKIADFGLARICDDLDSFTFMTLVGTPKYSPLEILYGVAYNYKVDIWAIGMTVYNLLTNSFIFSQKVSNKEMLKAELAAKCYNWEPISHINPQFRDLIQRMLEPDPNYRISVDEIKAHKLLTPSFSLGLNSMEEVFEKLTELERKRLILGYSSSFCKIKDSKIPKITTSNQNIFETHNQEMQLSKAYLRLINFFKFRRNQVFFLLTLLSCLKTIHNENAEIFPQWKVVFIYRVILKWMSLLLDLISNSLQSQNSPNRNIEHAIWLQFKDSSFCANFEEDLKQDKEDIGNLQNALKGIEMNLHGKSNDFDQYSTYILFNDTFYKIMDDFVKQLFQLYPNYLSKTFEGVVLTYFSFYCKSSTRFNEKFKFKDCDLLPFIEINRKIMKKDAQWIGSLMQEIEEVIEKRK